MSLDKYRYTWGQNAGQLHIHIQFPRAGVVPFLKTVGENITDRWIKAVMAAGYNSGGHKDQVEGERELSWQWRHRRMAGSLREATKKTVSTFPHIFYSLQFIQIQSSQMRVWLSPVISSMEFEQIFKFEKESYMPEEFNDSSQCMLCSVCVLGLLFLAPQ